MKTIFEGKLELESVDEGGQVRIARLDECGDGKMFVRVQSWDESLKHTEFHLFENKLVRITIEVLEDATK